MVASEIPPLNIAKITVIGRHLDSLNNFINNVTSQNNLTTELHGLITADLSIPEYIKNEANLNSIIKKITNDNIIYIDEIT